MSEIKRDPIYGVNESGDDTVTFDEQHTLSDIARWICLNPDEAAEVQYLIGQCLQQTEGMVIQ